jgi:hypothetical protein
VTASTRAAQELTSVGASDACGKLPGCEAHRSISPVSVAAVCCATSLEENTQFGGEKKIQHVRGRR